MDIQEKYMIDPRMRPEVLTPDEVKALHETSVKVFEEVGILCDSLEAAKIYEEGGATVTYSEKDALVKIPRKMLEACLETAPKRGVWYGRVPESDYDTKKGNVCLTVFGECVKARDLDTGEVRDSRKEDLGNMTRLCDYYDDIRVVERACGALDRPAATEAVHNLDIMLRSTTKPIFLAAMNRANARKMIEMSYIAAGGEENFRSRPFVNIFVCPVSPLTMGRDACEIIIETAKGGAGLSIIPMGLSGATAPATLAGTVVETNVDVLASVILAQLVRKGTPCFYCSMTTIMDMRYLIAAGGCPEHGLIGAAVVKMADYYGLPSWVGGGVSDSKLPDAQTGSEFAINAMSAAMSGANVIFGAGALESCLTVDYAKMIIDCESMAYIRRIIRGIPVDEDALAFEQLKNVGPSSDYLLQKHTRDHGREQVQVTVFDRESRESWEAKGSLSAAEKATRKAKEILASHKVPPLPEGAEEKITRLIADFEKELGVR